MEETKEIETKERITYGDVHICLSCEHRGTCKFTTIVDTFLFEAAAGDGFVLTMPDTHRPDIEYGKLQVGTGEVSGASKGKNIWAGIRVCPRHSSGNPRLTHGIIE